MKSLISNPLQTFYQTNDEFFIKIFKFNISQSGKYVCIECLQLNQGPQISIGLRGLKNASLRLQEFHLDLNSPVVIGKRIFYSATWNEHNVTLCIAFDLAVHVSRREFYLAPIVEFMDTLTEEILDKSRVFGNKEVEGKLGIISCDHRMLMVFVF